MRNIYLRVLIMLGDCYGKRANETFICSQSRNKWLESAEADGLKIDAATKGKIEVSFLLSYAGENLSWLRHVHRKNTLSGASGYIDHEGDYTEKDLRQAE